MGDEPVAPNDGVASLVGSEAAFAVINEASVCSSVLDQSALTIGTARRGFTFLPGTATQQTSQRPPDAGNPVLTLRCGMRVQWPSLRWHAGFVRPPHRSRTVHRPNCAPFRTVSKAYVTTLLAGVLGAYTPTLLQGHADLLNDASRQHFQLRPCGLSVCIPTEWLMWPMPGLWWLFKHPLAQRGPMMTNECKS